MRTFRLPVLSQSRLLVAVVVLAIAVVGIPAWALTAEQEAKLVPSDDDDFSSFGVAVAVDGDTAVIGAYMDDDNGSESGSAYVFTRAAGVWTEQAKLLASDGAADDYFGDAVALDGDTAVIGASWDDDNGDRSGSAYVFTRTAGVWTEQAKLLPSDGAIYDFFGRSVALDGGKAVIGAHGAHNDNGDESGAAYVFTRTAGVWTEQAKLLASDGADDDSFGKRVSLDGDTAIIGAGDDDDNDHCSGSAYVFIRGAGGWTEQAKLLPSDGASYDYFGDAVAVDDDTALIGAAGDDIGGASGSAYVFTRTAGVWTEQAKLRPADLADGEYFGVSAALDGDTAVIGSHVEAPIGSDSGVVYLFDRMDGVWTEEAKLLSSGGAVDDQFGWAVALDDDTAVIGAPHRYDADTVAGAAYVFRLLPGDGDEVPAFGRFGVAMTLLAVAGIGIYFVRRGVT